MPKTEEVFGIRAKLVLSYVERTEVDQRFQEALESEHHIVIYGSSKQGKTSLRQKHLNENRCVIVHCGPRMSIEALYQSVLRQAGARINTMETRTTEAKAGAKVSTGFLAKIPFLAGGEVKAEVSLEGKKQQELATEFIAYDLGDAQSIAELLIQLHFTKWVVLENYHYLPQDTQRAIAYDLKTFHEVGIRFLVLGIWKEANLLVTHNGDLQDRIVEVPVEPWNDASFDAVAKTGSEILNISFKPEILTSFKANAYGNIGLFQEFLKYFCTNSGVIETTDSGVILDSSRAQKDTITQKLESQTSALVKGLQGIAAKSRIRRGEKEQPLLLPYYFVQVILDQDIVRLQEGIDRHQLLDLLRNKRDQEERERVRGGDVTNLLTKLPLYQSEMNPPLFYYDGNSRRIRIVDSRIFFVLANANRAALAEDIPMPELDPEPMSLALGDEGPSTTFSETDPSGGDIENGTND